MICIDAIIHFANLGFLQSKVLQHEYVCLNSNTSSTRMAESITVKIKERNYYEYENRPKCYGQVDFNVLRSFLKRVDIFCDLWV